MRSTIRDSIRAWRRSATVAVIATLSLALGIGATTTFYSLVDHLLLRSLPVPDPHELAVVRTEAERTGRFSFPVWEQIRERSHLYDSAFALSILPVNMARQGEVDMAQAVLASGGVFKTLRVSPSIGRLYDERDDGPQGGPDGLVAVISHAYWQRRFGGARDVVGRSISVEGAPFTVVGVTPRSLRGLRVGTTFDIALPLGTEPRVREFSLIHNGRIAFLSIMMRLAPGRPVETISARLQEDQPAIRAATLSTIRRPQDRDAYLRSPFIVVPAADSSAGFVAYYGDAARILLGLAVLLLLACCGNVATVMLAHGAARHRELGVRRALGASRWEPARQLLGDSLVLSVPGAAAGLILTVWAGPWILAQWNDVGLDDAVRVATNWRVWAVAAAAGMITGILCGLAAAWRAARINPVETLSGSRVRHATSERGQLVFVCAQLAFSVVVAVTAALLLRSYYTVVSAPVLDHLDG
jgi:putative ABC transport system permease protein